MTSYIFNLNTMRASEAVLNYQIDNSFFASKDYSPIQEGNVEAQIKIERKTDLYNVYILLKGSVVTMCTRCMDDLDVNIESSNKVMVKMTKTPREDDEYIYVNEEEGDLDLEPLIYDFIVLAVPERHVHAEGECNEEMEQKLREYLVTEEK